MLATGTKQQVKEEKKERKMGRERERERCKGERNTLVNKYILKEVNKKQDTGQKDIKVETKKKR